MNIKNDLAISLNKEATELVSILTVESKSPADPDGIFRPNYLSSEIDITGKNLPTLPVHSVIDIGGYEIARFFAELKPSVGLAEKNYERFIRLCTTVQHLDGFRSQVSLSFIADTIFYWLKQRHLKSSNQTMTEYLLTTCISGISNQTVWIPLAGTAVEVEMPMGRGVFKSLSEIERRQWIVEWNIRKPQSVVMVNEFLAEISLETVSVFATNLVAEPIKAVETALEEAESALSILRYFSPANFNPSMYTYCTVLGKQYVERPRHMLLKGSLLVSAGSTEANMRWRHPWKIDEALFSSMRNRGFDTLTRLNGQDESERTEFQNSVMRALAIYSKSSLAQNLNDKLLYVVVALEYLLLKNNKEPLQKNVSDRMALLVGKSLDERLFIIKNYKEAYALRSGSVHHGITVTETDVVKSFLQYAWWTINRLIEDADRFQTKEEMINYVDDIKFT